jgi:uncharacterized iron-regulated membrane protein
MAKNQYTAALIVVFSTGSSLRFASQSYKINFNSGTYLATSIVSVFLLVYRRSNSVHSLNRGQKVTLAYTLVMCLVTLIWTGSTVYDIGLTLVKHRKTRPDANSQAFWQLGNALQNALGTAIFIGSDALMVCI